MVKGKYTFTIDKNLMEERIKPLANKNSWKLSSIIEKLLIKFYKEQRKFMGEKKIEIIETHCKCEDLPVTYCDKCNSFYVVKKDRTREEI